MAQHNLTRREVLTSGMMSGVSFGSRDDGGTEPDAPEEREINETLKSLVSELKQPEHSMLPGDLGAVAHLRGQMIEFMKGANKWPDFIDVGHRAWCALYDWHVRFGVQPVVMRLPDNRYGLTFMFTTLVLRPEQPADYYGLPYDKER